MPFGTLFERLSTKTRGRIIDLERGIARGKPADLSERDWTQFLADTDVQDGWIDYYVSL